MERTPRQKINKETEHLSKLINQMNQTDLYRTFHPIATQYSFFSSTLGYFSREDHMLDDKMNLNKFKTTEIIQSILFEHNGRKLEISNK